MGHSYTYPEPKAIGKHYSGCVKVWHDDLLVLAFRFDNGAVMRVEITEPEKKKITCTFDIKRNLSAGPADTCGQYRDLPIRE